MYPQLHCTPFSRWRRHSPIPVLRSWNVCDSCLHRWQLHFLVLAQTWNFCSAKPSPVLKRSPNSIVHRIQIVRCGARTDGRTIGKNDGINTHRTVTDPSNCGDHLDHWLIHPFTSFVLTFHLTSSRTHRQSCMEPRWMRLRRKLSFNVVTEDWVNSVKCLYTALHVKVYNIQHRSTCSGGYTCSGRLMASRRSTEKPSTSRGSSKAVDQYTWSRQ